MKGGREGGGRKKRREVENFFFWVVENFPSTPYQSRTLNNLSESEERSSPLGLARFANRSFDFSCKLSCVSAHTVCTAGLSSRFDKSLGETFSSASTCSQTGSRLRTTIRHSRSNRNKRGVNHFFNSAYSATRISPSRYARISSSTHSSHAFPSGISLAKTVATGFRVALKAESGMNGS